MCLTAKWLSKTFNDSQNIFLEPRGTLPAIAATQELWSETRRIGSTTHGETFAEAAEMRLVEGAVSCEPASIESQAAGIRRHSAHILSNRNIVWPTHPLPSMVMLSLRDAY